MRNRGPICEIHAEEVKGLEADQCSLCLGDLARFREMSMEDRDAVEAVRQALRVVEGSRDLTALIPEIGMNITYAKPGAVDAEGVVGVPGRIRPIAAHPRSAHTPEFGGSSHVARAVLAMMGFHPGLRSAMSLRFDWRVVDICGRLGLPVSHFDRAEEPPEVKAVDGRTIQWGVGQAVRSSAEPPRVIYDVGDVGKEPLIFLFGQNPMEVAQLAVRIAKEYAGSKKSTVN
jgi:predicted fused transcriptional regulator/phosphomethylpyrimidine kinase